jgi:UDP-2,3-diacylglucosamine hydrolase
MLMGPAIIVSDLHLGASPPGVERDFIKFLRALPGAVRSLVINGDLFDFWFEWKSVIPRQHFRTLAALADLADEGISIVMTAGNHDGWGGDFLRESVGMEFHADGRWRGELAGWSTLVEHGDGLRKAEDRKYRALRAVIRHPASITAFRWLHPDWGTRLARGSSSASREHRLFGDAGAGLRDIAHARLTSDPSLQLMVFGHSHSPALETASPGGGVYANAGSWLEQPTYLAVTPEQIQLRRWSGSLSAEGDCLDAIDRPAEKSLTHP